MNANSKFEDHAKLLSKIKHGSVTAEIWGPRIGWRWRNVTYYRWTRSTKVPGKWERVFPARAHDQPYLQKCVKSVCEWLEQEDEALSEIHRLK